MRANLCDSRSVSSGSAFAGAAQVNLEVQKAAILFDSDYFGYVEMSCIQKLELAPEVEIKKSLHRAMRSADARLHPRIATGLFYFRQFLVPPGLRAPQGDGHRLPGP